MAHRQELSLFNSLYSTGRYLEAADRELKKGGIKTDPSRLLDALQAAAALRYAGDYRQSSLLFDRCEEIIKYHKQLMLAGTASTAGSLLINDAVLDYRATEYDGIMVNTYKALNFWQTNEEDLVRVEFNRGLDRQRRAKERFAVEIERLKEQLASKEQEENRKFRLKGREQTKVDFEKSVNNPEIEKIVKKKYSNLYEFSAYPDFINPFTTYMAGLFFMSAGDYPKAVVLLKEAYGMMEQNPVVAQDFAQAERLADGKVENHRNVWIIFENGLGPVKEEFRIDLPVFLFTRHVKYTGIALPRLIFRSPAYPYLIVKEEGKKSTRTIFLSSMDRVVQTEFKKKYRMIVTRALASSLIKTLGQYAMQREFGNLGGIASAIYQAATTAADIRIWTALPKEFQVAKVKAPDDGLIVLQTPAGGVFNVEVPLRENSLVYVKIPAAGAKVVYDVIKM